MDSFGQICTTISSWLNSENITPSSKINVFKVIIKNGFSLKEGDYFIDIKIFTNQLTRFNNVSNFTLINSSYTGYKYPLKSQHGKVYTPNDWIINNENIEKE